MAEPNAQQRPRLLTHFFACHSVNCQAAAPSSGKRRIPRRFGLDHDDLFHIASSPGESALREDSLVWLIAGIGDVLFRWSRYRSQWQWQWQWQCRVASLPRIIQAAPSLS